MSEAPALVDHTTKQIVTYGPAIGALYAAGHVFFLAIRRLLRYRARRLERRLALYEAVKMLLDVKREELNPPAGEDERDALSRLGARKQQIDEVRDRFWLALGKKRSVPSHAPTETPGDP